MRPGGSFLHPHCGGHLRGLAPHLTGRPVQAGQTGGHQVGREEDEVVRQLRQRLSILLTRDNVAMIGSRAPTIPPAEVDDDIDYDYV